MNWNLIDELWRNRHEPDSFAEIESSLDRALFNSSGTPEYALLWRWARLSHFRAMQALDTGDKSAAEQHYEAAAQEAAKSVSLQPNRVEGRFWCGTCMIEAARLRGALSSLRVLGAAQKHIARAAQIDEEYHFAGPLRIQARISHAKPMVLGGLLDRSLVLYRRALQIAPHNSTTLLYYAEALIANQERVQARNVLTQIIDSLPDDEWRWEQNRDRRLASSTLQSSRPSP